MIERIKKNENKIEVIWGNTFTWNVKKRVEPIDTHSGKDSSFSLKVYAFITAQYTRNEGFTIRSVVFIFLNCFFFFIFEYKETELHLSKSYTCSQTNTVFQME